MSGDGVVVVEVVAAATVVVMAVVVAQRVLSICCNSMYPSHIPPHLRVCPPPPASPDAVPLAPLKPLGCFTKGAKPGSNLLPHLLAAGYGSMTPLRCAALAAKGGYTVFAVQGGSYCFAGLNSSLAVSMGPSGACDLRCAGDQQQACGGASANNVFVFGGNGRGLGCSSFLAL